MPGEPNCAVPRVAPPATGGRGERGAIFSGGIVIDPSAVLDTAIAVWCVGLAQSAGAFIGLGGQLLGLLSDDLRREQTDQAEESEWVVPEIEPDEYRTASPARPLSAQPSSSSGSVTPR